MARRAIVSLAAAALALAQTLGDNTAASQADVTRDGPPELLVSRQLLEAQHLSVGEVVSISADPKGDQPQPFRIAGVYEPLPDPMRLGALRHEVRLHLPDLVSLTSSADSVDAINVALPDPATAAAFAREVAPRLPGMMVRSTSAPDEAQRAATFIVLDRFHLAIAIVTVIGSSVFLLALTLMLVDERRETVGILRLIGFRRRRILLYMLAEGVVLAGTGAITGVVLAALLQGGVNRFFQWRYDTALLFVRVTPGVVARSIAMSVPLGVLASIASSWTLLRHEAISLSRR